MRSPITSYVQLDDEKKGLVKRVGLPILIILGGFLMMSLFVTFKRTPPKTDVQTIATLVDVMPLKKKSVRRIVSGYGTTQARQVVEVRPQVSGNILSIHPQLQVGGRIPQGEVLFQIDPSDFELAVKMKEAARARAEFELKLEEGNQVVAKREWELLEKGLKTSEIGRELALRKPHLAEKRASLLAAESDLKQAQLNLERTKVTTPFDAVVLSEQAEQGQYVSPQVGALQIAATNEFQIELRVPRSSVSSIRWNDRGEPAEPRKARVSQQLRTGETLRWEGKLIRLLGNVDESGRMSRILIGVESPLVSNEKQTPLLLGSYVRVEIDGEAQKGGYEIPRRALREGDRVWLVGEEQKLRILPVQVVFTQESTAYIRGEISEDSLLVLNNIAQPLAGMLLEVPDEQK